MEQDLIQYYLPKVDEYRFEVYTVELNEEWAIKVSNGQGQHSRLVTISKKDFRLKIDNQTNCDKDTDYPDAFSMFMTNFKPSQRTDAVRQLLDFVDKVLIKHSKLERGISGQLHW